MIILEIIRKHIINKYISDNKERERSKSSIKHIIQIKTYSEKVLANKRRRCMDM